MIDINDFEIFRKVNYSSFENNDRNYQLSTYPYLDIVFNDQCNAKCKFCIGHLVHKREKANVETIKEKSLYAINKMGVKEVLLLGGEPTINDDIFDIIDFLKDEPINKICMTTNGIRMTKDPIYAEKIFSSGITHINLSLMTLDPEKQKYINGSKVYVGLESLKRFYSLAEKNGVKLRVNNNVFKGNNDSLTDMLLFYGSVRHWCHSVKFSPLLKTDDFSTVNEVTEFNKEHLLTDAAYDELWHSMERAYYNYPIVRNPETFGFVEYSMILADTPIILNYNQHGKLRQKVVSEGKINNLKLLTTGELSLSWNREESDFFIHTDK